MKFQHFLQFFITKKQENIWLFESARAIIEKLNPDQIKTAESLLPSAVITFVYRVSGILV